MHSANKNMFLPDRSLMGFMDAQIRLEKIEDASAGVGTEIFGEAPQEAQQVLRVQVNWGVGMRVIN